MTMKLLANQLQAGFLVYRQLMSDELRASTITNPVVTKEIHGRLKDYWGILFTPNIESGLKLNAADLSDEFVRVAAGKYTGILDKQLNEVSDRAFNEAYRAGLNKGWEQAKAWDNASEAWGLDPARMRKWIVGAPGPSDNPYDTRLHTGGEHVLSGLIEDRAKVIGEHESRTIVNLGQQADWAHKVDAGLITEQTLKKFVTAQDELVCKVCGPLNNRTIPLDQTFSGFYMPPMHINCRCEVVLINDPVSKMAQRYRTTPPQTTGERQSRPPALDGPQTTETKRVSRPPNMTDQQPKQRQATGERKSRPPVFDGRQTRTPRFSRTPVLPQEVEAAPPKVAPPKVAPPKVAPPKVAPPKVKADTKLDQTKKKAKRLKHKADKRSKSREPGLKEHVWHYPKERSGRSTPVRQDKMSLAFPDARSQGTSTKPKTAAQIAAVNAAENAAENQKRREAEAAKRRKKIESDYQNGFSSKKEFDRESAKVSDSKQRTGSDSKKRTGITAYLHDQDQSESNSVKASPVANPDQLTDSEKRNRYKWDDGPRDPNYENGEWD